MRGIGVFFLLLSWKSYWTKSWVSGDLGRHHCYVMQLLLKRSETRPAHFQLNHQEQASVCIFSWIDICSGNGLAPLFRVISRLACLPGRLLKPLPHDDVIKWKKKFRVTGLLCREFTGDRWIPRTKASDAEILYFLWSLPEQTGVFCDLRPNQQLSKQWRRWWFETLPRSLWRQCNATSMKNKPPWMPDITNIYWHTELV